MRFRNDSTLAKQSAMVVEYTDKFKQYSSRGGASRLSASKLNQISSKQINTDSKVMGKRSGSVVNKPYTALPLVIKSNEVGDKSVPHSDSMKDL